MRAETGEDWRALGGCVSVRVSAQRILGTFVWTTGEQRTIGGGRWGARRTRPNFGCCFVGFSRELHKRKMAKHVYKIDEQRTSLVSFAMSASLVRNSSSS